MQVLGIVAPDPAAASALAERVADRLADRGRVATVSRPEAASDGGAVTAERSSADRRVTLAGDGTWTASGGGWTLDDALDDLAPAHDYALAVGFPAAEVPTVAVGGREHAGETVAAPADADAADVDAVADAVEAFDPRETLSSLVAEVTALPEATYAGAVATFTGRVRTKEDPEDDATEYLEFEKYEGVAAERFDAIRTDLEAREGVRAVRLHHRTGVVEAGEDIVFVVVLAGHRGEAFRTVEDGIDRLKDEVPLFKKEVTVEETFWSHERPD